MTKRWIAACALLLTAGLLTGCSQKNEYTEAGMQAIRDLDYEKAMADFAKARESGENERLITRGCGIAAMGQSDYETAREYFLQSLQLSDGYLQPVDYDLNYYLAAADSKLGNYAEAEESYTAILNLREEKDALFLRGNARLAQGNFEEAKQDFDRVVELDPDNYARITEIFTELTAAGYREAGMDYLQSILNRGADKLSTLEKGKIYYYMGDYSNAAANLEEARTESIEVDSFLYLGLSYEALGEYNYASNVYESCISQCGDNAMICNQQGLCYMKMGRYSEALGAFTRGRQIGDSSVAQSLAYNEIVANEYLGKFREAAVLMEDYLRSYPDDEAAAREAIFLETR